MPAEVHAAHAAGLTEMGKRLFQSLASEPEQRVEGCAALRGRSCVAAHIDTCFAHRRRLPIAIGDSVVRRSIVSILKSAQDALTDSAQPHATREHDTLGATNGMITRMVHSRRLCG